MLQKTAVVSSKERESRSAGQVLFGKGGLGSRRRIDFGTAVNLLTVEGLARMAIQQPLELLSLLPDIVPEVGLALWNSSFLACGQESVRIKVVGLTDQTIIDETRLICHHTII